MLISCFQCRQQLDVPEDSAGKRVRCPHCQYVIVVPSKPRAAEADGIQAPTTALPSMELDADLDKPAATTKLPAQPLPPFDLPPTETGKPDTKPEPPPEDLPPMPSIERGKRRRVPMSPLPASSTNWRRVIGVGAFVGVIVIGLCVWGFSSRSRGPRGVPKVVAFHNPPQPMPMPPKMQGMGPNQALPGGLWTNFQEPKHRFKAQFPGQPAADVQNFHFPGMTVFAVRHPAWEFAIAHATLTEKQFLSIPLQNRFRDLHVNLCNTFGAVENQDKPILLADVHPGREWDLSFLQDNCWLFVRTYYVHAGNTYHHYVLTAKAPLNVFREHPDINRFFNSFNFIGAVSNDILIEEFDALNNGGRRDNEFTALALHPKEPIAVTGTVASRLKIVRMDDRLKKEPDGLVENNDFTVQDGKPVEQLAISQDGHWLAVAAAGDIRFWRDWTVEKPKNWNGVKGGLRCIFTKEHHLLVVSKDHIKELDLNPIRVVSTLLIPNVVLKGFALSADERTLAVYGDKAIMLWNWPEKKLLGRIEAHDAAITTVAFSPDSKTLASTSADRTIKLWNVDTREARATLRQHAWTVWTVAFTPDGKHLASGGLDGMLLLWELEPKQPRLIWAQSHQFPVRAVAFDAKGKTCYVTCKHPEIDPNGGRQFARQLCKIAWDDMKPNPQEAERIVAQQAGLHLPTTSVMSYLSPDGETFVSTTDGLDNFQTPNRLRVWDTISATLKYTHSMKYKGVLSPDGKWFAFAKPGVLNQVQLLAVPTNRVSDTVVTYQGNDFPLLMFAADSRSFWFLRNHEFVQYEIQTPQNDNPIVVQKRILKLKEPNDTRIVSIIPGRDQKSFLVEYSSTNNVLRKDKLHSLADGSELPRQIPGPGVWSPYLYLRQMGLKVELYDYLQGKSETIGQQRHPTTQHAISPDGKLAVSGFSVNNQAFKATLWDLQAHRPLLTFPDPRARLGTALRFSSDGRYLAMVTGESWTRIVPLDWLQERKALLPCHPNEVAVP
jgi:WD40 repeat protein/DNA-directed RNA polymerase subunit RPC12/RpoP